MNGAKKRVLSSPIFLRARMAGRWFAGIWDYSDVQGDIVPPFAILTDEPNALVAQYHDRMLVVLEASDHGSTSIRRWTRSYH